MFLATIKIHIVFWVSTQCNSGKCDPTYQSITLPTTTVKMQALYSFETLWMQFYQTTRYLTVDYFCLLGNYIFNIMHATCSKPLYYTGCLQTNGAVSKVNKKFISQLTRAKRTPLAAATVQVSHALPAVRSLVLTAGLRGQFPRWRRSRKRLSVCSVLRCPDLWLQCSSTAAVHETRAAL